MEVNRFGPPRNFETLKAERARLESFSRPPGWPIPFIRPEDCARAGFFFLRDADKVQCAFCGGVTGEWEVGDNPMIEHQRHFPRCPYICGLPVGNIPLGEEQIGAAVSDDQEESVGTGIDVCGPNPPDLGQLLADDQPASGNGTEAVTSLAIKTCGNGPAHRGLVTLPSRIKTFTNWPLGSGQTPDVLAEAGFFSIGRRDDVKCFYCDGGLRNWEASDDPWLEHARWFPKCTYLILIKGDGFVEEVNRVNSQPQNPALASGDLPRTVSDQEIRELCNTPIVRAALDMGMELGRVRDVLKRKIEHTGEPFFTTEDLLEAVLGRDPEYESDSDSDTDDIDEEENLGPGPSQGPSCPPPTTASTSMASGVVSGSSEEAASSSSSFSEHSSGSGDEAVFSVTVPPPSNANSTAGGSDDSCVASATPEKDEPVEEAVASCVLDEDSDTDLEEEVRKLREQCLCQICMDNQRGIVFLPCGHMIACARCATALSNCALCRQPIKAVVRAYLS